MKPRTTALIFSALALAGCGDFSIEEPPPPMPVGTLHEDIPAPEGFTYVENFGNTSPTGAFRVTRQVLRGPRRAQDCAGFYRDVFPRHGWALERDQTAVGGDVNMSFTKKAERCVLEIREQGSTTSITVKVDRKE